MHREQAQRDGEIQFSRWMRTAAPGWAKCALNFDPMILSATAAILRPVQLRRGWLVLLVVLLAGLCVPQRSAAAELVMTEPQVKALCLLNFAKYVNWPAGAFARTNDAIRIGVLGDAKVHAELRRAVEGKLISGRPVTTVELSELNEGETLHIFFVGSSEKGRAPEFLSRLGTAPTLTVGEHEGFMESGGMMVFVKRENKVRFEVNLAPARQAGIQISSRLLALADAVKGKE